MLSGQPEERPFRSTTRRNASGDGVSPKNGQRGSTGALSSSWTNRGVLSCMDQEQAGTAAVPCAGPEEGADGNAVGLPDLQPAVLDSPVQATHNPSSYLKEYRRRRRRSPQASHKFN